MGNSKEIIPFIKMGLRDINQHNKVSQEVTHRCCALKGNNSKKYENVIKHVFIKISDCEKISTLAFYNACVCGADLTELMFTESHRC